ncbi:MAG: type II toxin-antitoxin system PemK/MazF family toxin [Chloroflexota bacterium]
MASIHQGDIWWADLQPPGGSEPGYRRPVVVVQQDAFNDSYIKTAVCVLITSNLNLVNAPGNVLLPKLETELPKESVANVSQLITIDKRFLDEYVSTISGALLEQILNGIQLIIGR